MDSICPLLNKRARYALAYQPRGNKCAPEWLESNCSYTDLVERIANELACGDVSPTELHVFRRVQHKAAKTLMPTTPTKRLTERRDP